MRPRRTVNSTQPLSLEGGNEDHDLWVQYLPDGDPDIDPNDPCVGMPAIRSVWEPTSAERAAIMAGANIRLTVMGNGHPPVALEITDEELGRGSTTD